MTSTILAGGRVSVPERRSDFEESTNFLSALMTDITATWQENATANLPLTDYREATTAESALFNFKRLTDMHIDDETVLDKSKIQNPYFSFAIKLKQLHMRVSNEKESYFASEIISLLRETPLTQFPIDALEVSYEQHVRQKSATEQKRKDLEEEINQLQTRLLLSEMEFIRTDDQLALLEAEVDNLELEIQRCPHGPNKKS